MTSPTPAPAPLDVRLMNWTATALFLGCALAALAGVAQLVLRLPAFAVVRIVVEGDLVHTSALSLRANVAPQLAGNFITMDLGSVQRAFEQVPWVRHAQVRREFPAGLRVRLREHDAVALWGAQDDSRLVNSDGQVFDAGADDAERLPRLIGADGQSQALLAMLRRLEPALAPLQAPVEQLELTGHGSWRVQLASGAQLQLGSGDAEQLLARVDRLTRTVARVAQQQGRSVAQIESADLRYASGYALRLHGVTTVEPLAPGARAPVRPAAQKNNHRG